MTAEELKPILDEYVFLLDCYEALFNLSNENESYSIILNNLNNQFRLINRQLDNLGLLS